ncbi:hypothetical protein E4K10_39680 [Streptomyces sp. T1317-0309]|nr:hypothetical protein E4K10_39680 [Streptomyces sp. T1317-0309]
MRSGGSVAADAPSAAASALRQVRHWAECVFPGLDGLSAPPANHSPRFLPSVRLTLETGTAALVSAALARLGTAEAAQPG